MLRARSNIYNAYEPGVFDATANDGGIDKLFRVCNAPVHPRGWYGSIRGTCTREGYRTKRQDAVSISSSRGTEMPCKVQDTVSRALTVHIYGPFVGDFLYSGACGGGR